MEYASKPWNPFAKAQDQHHEPSSFSRPITAHRHLNLRKQHLRADTEQGRVPPHPSDGTPRLTRSATQASIRLQQGLRLWHNSRPCPVSPSINTQPAPRFNHQHHQPLYHHQQHRQPQQQKQKAQQQYMHAQQTIPRHSFASDTPHFYPAINSDSIDSTRSTSPFLSSPFAPFLRPLTPQSSSHTPCHYTKKVMGSNQDTVQSPPTPLSSPRGNSGGGSGTSAPPSDSMAAFLAHFPARSALILAQSAQPAPTETRTQTASQPAEPADFYAYCLDRGNGMYTRLIPADVLPAMTNVPPLLASSYGMRVLPEPPLHSQHPIIPLSLANLGPSFAGPGSTPRTHQLYNNSMPPPATSSSGPHHSMSSGHRPARKNKIYCSKWVHDGTCAFTQQGCKYKHEMPHDSKTQHDLGLFQGYPAWYKKWQQEQAQQQLQQLHSAQHQQMQDTSAAETFSPSLPSLLAPPPPPPAQGRPATPLPMPMRARIPSGQQESAFGGQYTPPPLNSMRAVSGGSLGVNTAQPSQSVAWPPVDQLADSFGRNLGFHEPTAGLQTQAQQPQFFQGVQAQNFHLLAQQQQHLRQPSYAGNDPTGLFPTSGAFYRPPNASSGVCFTQGPVQALLSSSPLRDPRSQTATAATDAGSHVFGPIGPPAGMAGFASPSTFDRLFSQAPRSNGNQGPINSFDSFSRDSNSN